MFSPNQSYLADGISLYHTIPSNTRRIVIVNNFETYEVCWDNSSRSKSTYTAIPKNSVVEFCVCNPKFREIITGNELVISSADYCIAYLQRVSVPSQPYTECFLVQKVRWLWGCMTTPANLQEFAVVQAIAGYLPVSDLPSSLRRLVEVKRDYRLLSLASKNYGTRGDRVDSCTCHNPEDYANLLGLLYL